MRVRQLIAALATTTLTACGSGQSQPSTTTTVESSVSADEQLHSLLDELWQLNMETFPGWATYEGVRDYDDRLADVSDEATEEYVERVEAIAAQVERIDAEALSPMSRDTRRMVLLEAARRRANMVCHSSWWDVNGLGGPQVDYPMIPVFFTIRNERDLENLEKRYRATATQIDQMIANLRMGLDRGYTPTRTNAKRAIEQLDGHLESPVADDPMLKLNVVDETEYDVEGLRSAVEDVVRPALAKYRDVLKDEVLPAARLDRGIADLPTGAECYAARIESHIGPGYSADELHQRGLDELETIRAGMVEVGVELGLDEPTARDVIVHVTEDEASFATSEDELLKKNEVVVGRAQNTSGRVFGRQPTTPVEVRAMEAHRAKDAPAAYYYGAPEDRSRPAIYYVNTADPTTRPLFNLEALAFHEAVPGHHQQIALAQEIPDVHVWRRNAGQTAYVEGWALYAEMLADELGLYSSPMTRFGMYNYQAWRAARLVIDTGLHHEGWTREQAIDFLEANTALPRSEVENEIDRYIAWPGQALAYMVGRMEIDDLRRDAEHELGDAFSLREFHDAVHARGAVPLTILRQNLQTWSARMTERTEDLPDFRDLWDFADPAGTREKFQELLSTDAVAEHDTYRLQLLTQIARTHSLDSEFDAAHAVLDELEPQLEAAEPVVEVRYLLERGRTFNSAKNVEEAKPLFERAWDVARRARLDGLAVDAAHMMGIAAEPDEARQWNEEAMAYAERSDDAAAKRWLGSLYNNMGWTEHDAGDFERALELFRKGWEWRKKRDDDEATRIAKWSVGRALRSLKRYDEALELQLELEKERAGENKPDGFVFEELGELYLAKGDEANAKKYFAQAYPLLEKLDWVDDDRLARLKRLAGL